VIGGLAGTDHPGRDVLNAAALEPPGGALPKRVAVEQQRDHHRRIMRRPAMPIGAIVAVERGEIQRVDGVDDKPREMTLRQPLAQARRQQQLLLAITHQEVLRHSEIVLTATDRSLRGRGTSNACKSR
jgi:hypothetical protein